MSVDLNAHVPRLIRVFNESIHMYSFLGSDPYVTFLL